MPHSLTLSIFVDALGWKLQERWGFLEDLLTYRAPIETVFGYSSTCDPTILTGLPPREHGHFAFYVYDPGRGCFPESWKLLKTLPRALGGRGRVRHWISRLGRQALGWTGYFQLYQVPFDRLGDLDYTEKRDIYMPGGILGGQPTLFDSLRRAEIPFHLSDWRRSETYNLRNLEQAIRGGEIRFAYLYLADMDGLLHAEGTTSPRVGHKLRDYESSIRQLVRTAEAVYDETRLLVFSDHGMRDVEAASDLMLRVEDLPLTWGRDYGSVFDATMARFWFADSRAERLVRRALAAETRGEIVAESTLARWGCDFAEHRYGELFFLLEPGVVFAPSDMCREAPAGMHGYRPEDPSSTAFFGSNNVPSEPPRALADLAHLMLEETGAPSLASLRREPEGWVA
ncbi:MAG: alkaline phosphatase family protein [Holophagales bacterium]|nr:alkaline phosphatase family protein [Holophagales bacterium]